MDSFSKHEKASALGWLLCRGEGMKKHSICLVLKDSTGEHCSLFRSNWRLITHLVNHAGPLIFFFPPAFRLLSLTVGVGVEREVILFNF